MKLSKNQIKKLLLNWNIDKNSEIDPVCKRGTEEKADNAWFVGMN